jgi:hypothetical protein
MPIQGWVLWRGKVLIPDYKTCKHASIFLEGTFNDITHVCYEGVIWEPKKPWYEEMNKGSMKSPEDCVFCDKWEKSDEQTGSKAVR